MLEQPEHGGRQPLARARALPRHLGAVGRDVGNVVVDLARRLIPGKDVVKGLGRHGRPFFYHLGVQQRCQHGNVVDARVVPPAKVGREPVDRVAGEDDATARCRGQAPVREHALELVRHAAGRARRPDVAKDEARRDVHAGEARRELLLVGHGVVAARVVGRLLELLVQEEPGLVMRRHEHETAHRAVGFVVGLRWDCRRTRTGSPETPVLGPVRPLWVDVLCVRTGFQGQGPHHSPRLAVYTIDTEDHASALHSAVLAADRDSRDVGHELADLLARQDAIGTHVGRERVVQHPDEIPPVKVPRRRAKQPAMEQGRRAVTVHPAGVRQDGPGLDGGALGRHGVEEAQLMPHAMRRRVGQQAGTLLGDARVARLEHDKVDARPEQGVRGRQADGAAAHNNDAEPLRLGWCLHRIFFFLALRWVRLREGKKSKWKDFSWQ